MHPAVGMPVPDPLPVRPGDLRHRGAAAAPLRDRHLAACHFPLQTPVAAHRRTRSPPPLPDLRLRWQPEVAGADRLALLEPHLERVPQCVTDEVEGHHHEARCRSRPGRSTTSSRRWRIPPRWRASIPSRSPAPGARDRGIPARPGAGWRPPPGRWRSPRWSRSSWG